MMWNKANNSLKQDLDKVPIQRNETPIWKYEATDEI